MSLKDTVAEMNDFLAEITADLEKAVNGNKAAAQRVRVNTIALEKTAKMYRKESVAAEKKGSKSKAAPKKTAAKKATAKVPKKKK